MGFLGWLSRARDTVGDWLQSAKQHVRARWIRFRYWLSSVDFSSVVNAGTTVGVYAVYVLGYGAATAFAISTYTDFPFTLSYVVADGIAFYFVKEELRELIVKIARKEVK